MAAAAVILGLLLIISVSVNLLYRRQIKKICRQISYIRENETNMKLTSSLDSREIITLTENINELIEVYNERITEVNKKDRQLRAILSGLSHDIRTPLTSLDGYFQIMCESDDATQKERYMTVIRQRIDALKNLLEELFTFSKLQDSDLSVNMEKQQINQIVYDSLFSYYDEFTSEGIEPNIDITDEILFVMGNNIMIQRITENIIKNSLVHSKSMVEVKLFREGDSTVFLCSNDTENPEDIDVSQVFDRFYKADKARTAASAGLGLAIAKQMTEKMNGSISASLNGDIFTITVNFKII
ncbi:MAG: HAMP domain-containing sensor histidine kinase [Oscillospiraceae bacterium]|nr:HAMP domain-containing sensor histidine kinase [Oscillospiraceae bacterium]